MKQKFSLKYMLRLSRRIEVHLVSPLSSSPAKERSTLYTKLWQGRNKVRVEVASRESRVSLSKGKAEWKLLRVKVVRS